MSAEPKAKFIKTVLDAASNRGCSPSARSLLSRLLAEAWPANEGDDWVVNEPPLGSRFCSNPVTVTELAREFGRDKRTVQRWTRELVDLGLALVVKGAGHNPTIYRLPPVREMTYMSPQRRHQCHRRGDISVTSEVTPVSPPSLSQDIKTPPHQGAALPRAAGADPIGRDLDGDQAVKLEQLRRRPAWYQGRRWIDSATCRELATTPGVTQLVIAAAMAEAREAHAEGLKGVPGFVVKRCREPDAFAVEREQDRRIALVEREARDKAEADRRALEAHAAAEAAQAIEEAEDAALESVGRDEALRRIEVYIRDQANRYERDMLAMRTPDERIAFFRRAGRLASVIGEAVA